MYKRNSTKAATLRWMNLAALLLMIMVNAAANLIPIGGMTTGEVSAAYPTLFTPSAFTFGIWGVIYALMTVFVVWQFVDRRRGSDASEFQSLVGSVFAVSCALNIGWMLAWHLGAIWLSVIFMFALFVSLAIINLRISAEEFGGPAGRLSAGGMQLYLGWITAASIANVSVLLVQAGWDRFGISDQLWTVIVVAVGMVLGSMFSLIGRRPFATVAVMWAYVGILVRHVGSDGFAMAYPWVVGVLAIALALMAISAVACFNELYVERKKMGSSVSTIVPPITVQPVAPVAEGSDS